MKNLLNCCRDPSVDVPTALFPKQKGIVLIITLLVLVAMVLASVGIIRMMDTSSLLVGNYSYRSSGNAYTAPPIEESIQELVNWFRDANKDQLYKNHQYYYASFNQDNDDEDGIPERLLAETPTGVKHYPLNDFMPSVSGEANTENEAYVVIERMCNKEGAPSDPDVICAKARFSGEGRCNKGNCGTGVLGEINGPETNKILYRITVRVDGPRETSTFGQAMIYL